MWTVVNIQLHPDKDDVGIAQIVWDQGGPDEFLYQETLKVSVAEAQRFKASAEAARDKHLATRTRVGQLAASLSSILNG